MKKKFYENLFGTLVLTVLPLVSNQVVSDILSDVK